MTLPFYEIENQALFGPLPSNLAAISHETTVLLLAHLLPWRCDIDHKKRLPMWRLSQKGAFSSAWLTGRGRRGWQIRAAGPGGASGLYGGTLPAFVPLFGPTDSKDASRAVKEYLAILDDAAFGAASQVTPKFVSPFDPAAHCVLSSLVGISAARLFQLR
jgi:hypothetical protein